MNKQEYIEAIVMMLENTKDNVILEFVYSLLQKTCK